MAKTKEQLLNILDQFQLDEKVVSAEPFGNGHINDTLKVTNEKGEIKYVLQRINHLIFTNVDMLQNNIHVVTTHIRKKLEEYHYIPNMGARMLAKGDSEIVGVITNYPNREEKFALQDPFVSEMIAALENAIRANGYYTMLHAAQTAAEIHRISQTWNAVGLIVMGLQANQCRELMQVTRKPIVFVDCYFDQGERYNNVGLDDEGGMRQMTEHLLKLGHRNMLFVGDQPVLWGVDARRLRGHQQALEAAGLAWQETHYFCVSKDRKRRGEDYQRMLEYVRMLSCTVCLFISDYYAVEAIDFLLDQGVRVPEDISITGFDDNILSRVIRPRLTTVHQNVTRKAQTALHVLFDILDKTAKEPVSLVLPTRIIRGSSVKDLRLNRTMHTNLTE